MTKYISYILTWALSIIVLHGYTQGTAYTLKGGLTLSINEWLYSIDNPLLQPHFAIEIEDFTADDQASLFAALGYYTHGSSSSPSFYINGNGDRVSVSGKTKVNNLELTLGAKGKKDLNEQYKAYYSVGIRGGYNISTNFLDNLEAGAASRFTVFPEPAFLNKINYGVSVGGGVQFQLSDRYDGVLEFNISPDISKQYDQPALGQISDPSNPNGFINIPAREIRNLIVAITFGLRLVKY